MKRLFSYLGRNFMSTLAGVYLLLQLGMRLHQHPAALLEQDTLDRGAAAVVLIAAQDPAKLRELVKKALTPSVPTSGTDDRKD